MNEAEISALVTRLSRPHRSGGVVIERAAILAAGADFPAVMAWIVGHSGIAETSAPPAKPRGLHGSRISDSPSAQQPLRFVLPTPAMSGGDGR